MCFISVSGIGEHKEEHKVEPDERGVRLHTEFEGGWLANNCTVTGIRMVVSDVDSGRDPEMEGEIMEEDSGGN